MEVKLSTLGETEQNFSALENSQNQQQSAQQENQENQEQEQQNNQQEQQQENEGGEQEQDLSVSQFSLGGGEEEQNKEQQQSSQEQQQAQPQFNLDEELKKIDRKELAKKLGFNDFAIEINDHIANGGSALDYLNAKSIDYNQVSDEELIKADLRKKYPIYTPQQIDLFFNRTYGVDELADEEEKEFAAMRMKGEAHTLRQQKIQEQSKFKIPEANVPQKDEAYEQWKANQDKLSQQTQLVTDYYLNHPATKTFHENKKVAIKLGEGVPDFNIVIDRPELITKTFFDGGESWRKATSTPQGEPDVQKQQLISIFMHNPQKFMQDIFNYGAQTGKRSLVAEGQNAQRPQAKMIPMEQETKPTYGIATFGSKPR